VTLTIGKVASLSKVTADTLRYYEREGLISPAAKSSGGYHLYDDEAARRVRFIKQAQHCGFALTEMQSWSAICWLVANPGLGPVLGFRFGVEDHNGGRVFISM